MTCVPGSTILYIAVPGDESQPILRYDASDNSSQWLTRPLDSEGRSIGKARAMAPAPVVDRLYALFSDNLRGHLAAYDIAGSAWGTPAATPFSATVRAVS